MEHLIDLNKKDLEDPFAAFWGLKKEIEMPQEEYVDNFPKEMMMNRDLEEEMPEMESYYAQLPKTSKLYDSDTDNENIDYN